MTNSEKATAIQNSLELGNGEKLNLINTRSYKQHNPDLSDGYAGIREFHRQLPMDRVYTNVVRAFQDGDYGFVHVDYYLHEPMVAFDIHRFENGQSVEHWDNLQRNTKIPNKSGRTMTDGKTKAIDLHLTAYHKEIAADFVNQVLIGRQGDSTKFFKNCLLIQHNPEMGDGATEFIDGLNLHHYTKLHLILGEGNFVLALSEGYIESKPFSFFDLFRFENSKIIEHWDVTEAIPPPEKQKNNNGKF